MSTFIDTIKKSTLLRANKIRISSELTPNTLDFCTMFNTPNKPAIIAEIKFHSPSQGRLYPGLMDPVAIAGSYLSNGAAALSILTEPDHFSGDIRYLKAIRDAYPHANLLLKDFVLAESQLDEACLYGANAVLLIVAFLNQERLQQLYHYARSLGLTPLIEVHDDDELNLALALHPTLMGINHRNLHTLDIDLNLSKTLIQSIPKKIHTIAESGIEHPSQLDEMAQRGFDGVLIGSSLMKHNNPGLALDQLLKRHAHAN